MTDSKQTTETRAEEISHLTREIGERQARSRDDKDFAIEFGGYLAQAAERYLAAVNAWEDYDEGDARRSLESAIYEFRKRAARAKPPERRQSHDS